MEGKIGNIHGQSEAKKGSDIIHKSEKTNHAQNIQDIFKERCRASKKAQLKTMTLSDQLDYRDP